MYWKLFEIKSHTCQVMIIPSGVKFKAHNLHLRQDIMIAHLAPIPARKSRSPVIPGSAFNAKQDYPLS